MTPLAELNLFTRGIPSLPPGKEIVALFDQIPRRLEAALPRRLRRHDRILGPARKRVRGDMTVGYSHRLDIVYRSRRDIDDLYKRLDEIAKEMKKWSAFGGGLLTMTRDQVRRRSEEADWSWRAREGFFGKRVFYRARLWLRCAF